MTRMTTYKRHSSTPATPAQTIPRSYLGSSPFGIFLLPDRVQLGDEPPCPATTFPDARDLAPSFDRARIVVTE
jgi:hypothetical protein